MLVIAESTGLELKISKRNLEDFMALIFRGRMQNTRNIQEKK